MASFRDCWVTCCDHDTQFCSRFGGPWHCLRPVVASSHGIALKAPNSDPATFQIKLEAVTDLIKIITKQPEITLPVWVDVIFIRSFIPEATKA